MAEDDRSVIDRILHRDNSAEEVQQEPEIVNGEEVPQTEPEQVVPAVGECPHGHGPLNEDQVCDTCGYDKKKEV